MNNDAFLMEDDYQELKVTFYPPLFLQRRIWVLDVLRAENVTKVLDVGCGEGQLLTVLSQPAPWLAPPPPGFLPPPLEPPDASDTIPPSPTYNDEIPNLHMTHVMGLDISINDLQFAIQGTAPPQDEVNLEEGSDQYRSHYTNVGLRWENLEAKIWKGGLEVINEDFLDIECIVSTEVIEHLPPEIFPAFAPVLLGIYHPRLFLITTPSYTFNARFTAPEAPPSARQGYPDPTGRTDRIFRHSDHKFEWTTGEFDAWCRDVAAEWGYAVDVSSIGHAQEVDEWGRDAELGGATSVAVFRRLNLEDREKKARAVVQTLGLEGKSHELLTKHEHLAHEQSQHPQSLKEICLGVRATMEGFRETILRVEELWFERDIAVMCGGWIEVLVRSVEDCEFLALKRDGDGAKNKRSMWNVELLGGITDSKEVWPAEGESSLDYIPMDWIPREDESESEGGWNGSTDMEGDISWNGSEDDDEVEPPHSSEVAGNDWGDKGDMEECGNISGRVWDGGWKQAACEDNTIPHSSGSSTTGWDGDESDDTT
ncbi:Small RNA 2'-O-methyltransferase [Hypsizygus marmoreus]|uniref:Small RNA 2'-O-methyltransferase n=1 Tax=Hypsizygus marmoreus TaxID=39966 RepID=A0A369JUS2_HYPMA|nr:Small RNA 2'-O-methyltransferase [Hypsizygus marmoreus]